jgi:glyoxylase-like metal-dependent hydrolase (beta-lactamase superfamily II)
VVANKPKMTRPTVYQFKLGDFTITNILEGYAHREDLHPQTGTNVTAEEIEAVATAHHLPFPQFEHQFIPSLVDTGDKLIALDPGFGDRSPQPLAGKYNERLADAGYDVNDVDIVVVTHCHPDHIGNLTTKDGDLRFPNAEIVFGETEFAFWKKGENIPDFRPPTLNMFNEVCLPLEDQARYVKPGDDIVSGVRAVDAFGHSAGHMAYHVESNGQNLMIMSDTVAHFAVSISHPEWHFAMDDDPEAAVVSRKRVLETVSSEKMLAIGFHMPFPSVGYIDKHGDGYKWVAHGYQMNLG